MPAWEYRVIPVRWDNKTMDWVGRVQKSPPGTGVEELVGWETILGLYGAHGWELVNVMPSGMLYASGLREALSFFKRPVIGMERVGEEAGLDSALHFHRQ